MQTPNMIRYVNLPIKKTVHEDHTLFPSFRKNSSHIGSSLSGSFCTYVLFNILLNTCIHSHIAEFTTAVSELIYS